MRDIRKLNIWKTEEKRTDHSQTYLNMDIAELNLSVRSYNCLKRAGCSCVGDILEYLENNEQGLRKIRNLGLRSEKEILEQLAKMQEYYSKMSLSKENPQKKKAVIKPAKSIWDTSIDQFHLSIKSLEKLNNCGIYQIKDLYVTNPACEPGWYAVRELFEKIPVNR